MTDEMLAFMEAQQADEDEDITLREARERHERGTRELEELLGEEGEEDTDGGPVR